MRVLVKYLSGLSLLAKKEREYVQPKNENLANLLSELAVLNGNDFAQEIFNPGMKELKDYITIVLNGRIVPQNALLTKRIADGDEIAWLPAILGGWLCVITFLPLLS